MLYHAIIGLVLICFGRETVSSALTAVGRSRLALLGLTLAVVPGEEMLWRSNDYPARHSSLFFRTPNRPSTFEYIRARWAAWRFTHGKW